MTEHKAYRFLKLREFKGLMRTKIIIDGRNLINKAKAEKLGFLYLGIGNL